MGMDGVEIVMTVEERFGIEISNDEAERIVKPRELIEQIATKVHAAPDSVCLSRRAFHKVRRALVKDFNISRQTVRPSSRFKDLFPAGGRRERWIALRHRLGAARWPELQLPMTAGLLAISSGLAAVYCSLAFVSTPLFPALGIAVIAGVIWIFRASCLRIAFPHSSDSVGGLAHFLAGQAPETLGYMEQAWSRHEIAMAVREIVIDVIDCENYSEDARFVEDLGLS